MDSTEHQSLPPTSARRRPRPVRTGAAALLVVGAVVAVHAAATSEHSGDAVYSRPEWSGGTHASGTAFGRGFAGQLTSATDAQQTGVVDIDVVLASGQRAAGTGMILTSNGEVLTNRHVVQNEMAISVTVAATGRTYDARVVGTASDTDVAVVQMEGASGLVTVTTARGSVGLGDAVVGVGNAGGQGGRPSAAPGQVTGLDQSITATDENGSDPEWLTGLIATDADIRPGDSGGPLLDGADKVVGMDTAGSSGGGDGYAIPIADALAAAHDIESGGAGSQPGSGSSQGGSGQGGSGQGGSGQGGTTQGGGAYLGVEVQDGPYGPQITGVVAGTPADRAGLTAGDTIVSVAGQRIGGVGDLAAVMASLAPGQRVDVTYVGTDGASQSAAVTLAAAPTA